MRYFRCTISGLLLAGAGLLSGCAVGPDYRLPDAPTPDSWQSPAAVAPDSAALASWWTTLNDSLLNEFIEQAIVQSPTVAQARARLAEARARYGSRTPACFRDSTPRPA